MTPRGFAAYLAVAAACAFSAAPAASAAPAPEKDLAYYSTSAEVAQSKSPAGLRRYLSTEQARFDLQSYPMYGSLIEKNGDVTSFSVMSQQSNNVAPTLPGLGYAVDGVMWNTGRGFTVGGVQGVPEYTLPFTMTQRPWSIRAQALSLGQPPQFVDVRVVGGKIGQRNAVYEVTAELNAGPLGSGTSRPSTVYVRATDTLGMAQWGFGPSGFMPQWLYPHQRQQITSKHDGSVEDYLKDTNDPMRGQGAYYYTTPLLRVDAFTITEGDTVVSQGNEGWLLMDAVTQSYGPKAAELVKSDVTWIEFSTQFPSIGTAMKIGQVTQQSVGAYPYATLADNTTGNNLNGTVATDKWPITGIRIHPIPGHEWTSPTTGLKYHLKYEVRLDGQNGQPDSVLTYAAVFPDQEVAFKGGRAVYEGLYTVTGTLNGQKVSGQAWGEVQPAGSLS